MSEFKTWQDYSMFSWRTSREFRYVRSSHVEVFLQTVIDTIKDRKKTISMGTKFWRAQLGHDFEPIYQKGEYIGDQPSPFPQERMKPLREEASEGRANPKGIPYLYLVTHRDTAMSEVRPWLGSSISVAQFKTIRELVVINCSGTEGRQYLYFEEPDAEEREKAVWSDIDRAFSEPVTVNDRTAEYVPTQIIAELFKSNGFDGIAYRSSFGLGHNIALFDIDAAILINCFLYEVEKLKYIFKEIANPYFIRKQQEKN